MTFVIERRRPKALVIIAFALTACICVLVLFKRATTAEQQAREWEVVAKRWETIAKHYEGNGGRRAQ
jgi:hypothetical protein